MVLQSLIISFDIAVLFEVCHDIARKISKSTLVMLNLGYGKTHVLNH